MDDQEKEYDASWYVNMSAKQRLEYARTICGWFNEKPLPPDGRLTLPYDELDDDGFCDCPECCGE